MVGETYKSSAVAAKSGPFHLLEKALRQRRAQDEEARQNLLLRVKAALAELAGRVSFSRAYIFGSCTRPGAFKRGISDVDVAFEGLADRDFFTAMVFLSAALGTDVDVVRMEDLAGSLLTAKIREEGIQWTRENWPSCGPK
ncbi:nucleotidyltransferase domain-containing protein [Desulfofundulus thermobenzoicus]|uniref:Nucleotidyltransferase domain-containing protein n=1 Tax=Desulfofundulus thermobenzoicus TaxID=29376 RepID=A0A6N7IUR5_9FIRM|nr:nucleotidyltransferase domain-containing protein [Desulfofundulus thermobenzoicus]MQL53249.1 nucleotidyltransferase domain-containing protein [Desulfofundulus thermobenzoicus]